MKKTDRLKKTIAFIIVIILLMNFNFITCINPNLKAHQNAQYQLNSWDTGNNDDFDNAEPISPGSHQGSVDVTTDPVDVYKIHTIGSVPVADVINISLEANVIGLVGIVILFNLDYVEITWSVISNTQNCTIYEVAITTGTHYIMVASFFGTINYWLNLSVTQIPNPQHDGDNDFNNATTANPDDSLTHNLNETYDYHDVFKLYAPKDMNITITADPSEDLGLEIYLYDAPDSTGNHLISEYSGFTDELVAVYNDTTIQEGWYYIYVLCQGWAGPESMDGSYIINFTVHPPNTPPGIDLADPNGSLWNSNNGIIMQEDIAAKYIVNLSQHFTDDGWPSPPGYLNFWKFGDESDISVTIHSNNTVTFTAAENWYGGPVTFTFYSSDTVFECYDTLNVTVQPVNDPMEVEVIEDQLWTQDVEVNLTLEITDIDGPELLITDNTTLFEVDSQNQSIKFTPTNDQVGNYSIRINVSDGEYTISFNFKATIRNVNDPPEIMKVGGKDAIIDNYLVFNATEDEWLNLTVEVVDIDHEIGVMDIFRFSEDAFDPEFCINEGNGNISFFPFQKQVGLFYVTITVDDGNGGQSNQNLKLHVANVNDAPEQPVIEISEIDGLTVYCYVPAVFDEDGDVVTYYWDFGDGSDPKKLSQLASHTYIQPGNYTITVQVADNNGGLSSNSINVSVFKKYQNGNTTNGNNGTSNGNTTNGDNGNGTTNGNGTGNGNGNGNGNSTGNGNITDDTNQTFIDTDNDLLDDEWERYFFGDLSQGSNDDYDEDGYNNLIEYKEKTNPADSESYPTLESGDTEDTSLSDADLIMLIIIITIISVIIIIITSIFIVSRRRRAEDRTWSQWTGKDKRTIYCPECKRVVADNLRECPYCQAELPMPIPRKKYSDRASHGRSYGIDAGGHPNENLDQQASVKYGSNEGDKGGEIDLDWDDDEVYDDEYEEVEEYEEEDWGVDDEYEEEEDWDDEQLENFEEPDEEWDEEFDEEDLEEQEEPELEWDEADEDDEVAWKS